MRQRCLNLTCINFKKLREMKSTSEKQNTKHLFLQQSSQSPNLRLIENLKQNLERAVQKQMSTNFTKLKQRMDQYSSTAMWESTKAIQKLFLHLRATTSHLTLSNHFIYTICVCTLPLTLFPCGIMAFYLTAKYGADIFNIEWKARTHPFFETK